MYAAEYIIDRYLIRSILLYENENKVNFTSNELINASNQQWNLQSS